MSLKTSLQNRMTNGNRSMRMMRKGRRRRRRSRRPLVCNGLTCPDIISSPRLFTPVGVYLALDVIAALALNIQL